MDVDIQGFTITTIPGSICSAEITRQPDAIGEKFAKVHSNLGEVEAVGQLIRSLIARGFIVPVPSDAIAGQMNQNVEIWTVEGARFIGHLTEGYGTMLRISGPEHGPGPHRRAVLSELSAHVIVKIQRRS